jgi:hypothetical protein
VSGWRWLAACAAAGCPAQADNREHEAEAVAAQAPAPAPTLATTAAAPRATAEAAPTPAIVSLTVVDAARGELDGASARGERFRVRLATRSEPAPHRRPLACHRLAQALGLDVVPATHRADLGLADLADGLGSARGALRQLEEEAVVGNDGTITALLQAEARGDKVGIAEVGRTARWAALAASPEPVPQAERTLVAGYVAVVVLDYLAANVLRARVFVDVERGKVQAADNESAFPGWVSSGALDTALSRVRPLVRFPAQLRERLRALDSRALAALLDAPRHEDALLGPRQLADYGDRRATLLSLMAARAVQYGESVAFSL